MKKKTNLEKYWPKTHALLKKELEKSQLEIKKTKKKSISKKDKPVFHYKSYHLDESIWSHLCSNKDYLGDDENAACCNEDWRKITCDACNKEFDRITNKANKCL